MKKIIFLLLGFMPFGFSFDSFCEYNRFRRTAGIEDTSDFFPYERYFYRSGSSWKQGWWLAPWKIALPLFLPVLLHESHRSSPAIYNALAAFLLSSAVIALLWLLHRIDKKFDCEHGH
jgi:hypothetical protein